MDESSAKTKPQYDLSSLLMAKEDLYNWFMSLNLLVVGAPLSAVIDGKRSMVLTKLDNNPKLVALRESFLLRTDSIYFHTNLLVQLYNSHIEGLNKRNVEDFFDSFGNQQRMRSAIADCMFLAEDTIVNIFSLFDYVANYAGLWLYGEQRMQIKWKGLVEFLNNPSKEREKTGRNRLLNDEVITTIRSVHNNFYKRLEQIRGDIVHNQVHRPGAEMSTSLDPSESSTLEIRTPEQMIKPIRLACEDDTEMVLDFIRAMILLSQHSYTHVKSLCRVLQRLHWDSIQVVKG